MSGRDIPLLSMRHPVSLLDYTITDRSHFKWQLAMLGFLVFVLLAAPKARQVIGAPIYLIDILAALLLISPIAGRLNRWVPHTSLTPIVSVYVCLVITSELIGLFLYRTYLESFYMIGRFTLAMSLFFVLPRFAVELKDLRILLKGVVMGLLAAASIAILYSLGPTRGFIMDKVFSIEAINPGWESFLQYTLIYGANEAAMRGRSLVGAATSTAGFLGVAWPLAFIAFQVFKTSVVWRILSRIAIVAAPVGILMTYGRTAWLMVLIVVSLIALFNMGKMRRFVVLTLVCGIVAFSVLNIDSDLFYFERISEATYTALEQPTEDESVKERVLSFVEPFTYLTDNPSWALVGVGRSGSKAASRGTIQEQAYNEGELATHSGFSIAFYSFGLPAAICQVLMVLSSFLIIFRRVKSSRHSPFDSVVWQSLLMSWCCMTIWWLSGHAMVGEPRGVMLLFTYYGLILVFEKLSQLGRMKLLENLRGHA